MAVGAVRVHRRSLQSYGTLVAVLQTSLLAMLVTSVNGVAAIVTVRLRVLTQGFRSGLGLGCGTLVAVLQTSLLATLVTSMNGAIAMVTVRLRVLTQGFRSGFGAG